MKIEIKNKSLRNPPFTKYFFSSLSRNLMSYFPEHTCIHTPTPRHTHIHMYYIYRDRLTIDENDEGDYAGQPRR